MDTNEGQFVEEEKIEAWMKTVSIGEVVKIKNEELVITKIRDREITLRLMSAKERFLNDLSGERDLSEALHRLNDPNRETKTHDEVVAEVLKRNK